MRPAAPRITTTTASTTLALSSLLLLLLSGCSTPTKTDAALHDAADRDTFSSILTKAARSSTPPGATAASISAISVLHQRSALAEHNLANCETPGFKRVLPVLVDSPAAGVRMIGTRLDTSQGTPIHSHRALDLYIDGPGYLAVEYPGARGGPSRAFTRALSLAVNADGELALAAGSARVIPPITVPLDSTNLSIDESGGVWAREYLSIEPCLIGRLTLNTFTDPGTLAPLGGTLYAQTERSGEPHPGEPGFSARGRFMSEMLEGSNVDPFIERIELERVRRTLALWSPMPSTTDQPPETITAADPSPPTPKP